MLRVFLLPEKNSQAKREGETPRVGFDKSTGLSIGTAWIADFTIQTLHPTTEMPIFTICNNFPESNRFAQ